MAIIMGKLSTTGKEKGICWTHQSLWNYFKLELALQLPQHTECSTQTFFHIGGFWRAICTFLKGYRFCHVSIFNIS